MNEVNHNVSTSHFLWRDVYPVTYLLHLRSVSARLPPVDNRPLTRCIFMHKTQCEGRGRLPAVPMSGLLPGSSTSPNTKLILLLRLGDVKQKRSPLPIPPGFSSPAAAAASFCPTSLHPHNCTELLNAVRLPQEEVRCG